jgi:hypothetical protein
VAQALTAATEAIEEVHVLETRLAAARERATAAQERLMRKETLLTSSVQSREEYPVLQRLMSALDVAKRGLKSAQSRCVPLCFSLDIVYIYCHEGRWCVTRRTQGLVLAWQDHALCWTDDARAHMQERGASRTHVRTEALAVGYEIEPRYTSSSGRSHRWLLLHDPYESELPLPPFDVALVEFVSCLRNGVRNRIEVE